MSKKNTTNVQRNYHRQLSRNSNQHLTTVHTREEEQSHCKRFEIEKTEQYTHIVTFVTQFLELKDRYN